MRFVVLDTETTGLSKAKGNVCDGHRVIEIGCVEIVDAVITGRVFHSFIDPEMSVDPRATRVHGIVNEFLVDKPKFADVVGAFIDFIGDSIVVIHNAPFDIAFLDQEFELLGMGLRPTCVFKFIDTLALARTLFPNSRNDLDSLCKRLGIAGRVGSHGALEDARLLAHVYLNLLETL